jgi:hypothetical protein
VHLIYTQGAPVVSLDTEDPLDISIDFVTRHPVKDVGFGIALFDRQGTKVYGTNTFVEAVTLPSPLPAAGNVRLSFQRTGLLPGVYSLDVCAHPAQGREYDYHRGLYQLTVRSSLQDSGLVRPPHTWSVHSSESLPLNVLPMRVQAS